MEFEGACLKRGLSLILGHGVATSCNWLCGQQSQRWLGGRRARR